MSTASILLSGNHVLSGIENFAGLIKGALEHIDPTFRGISLGNLHTKISPSEVNTVRMAIFRSLNAAQGHCDQILDMIAGEQLRAILGPDLLVQTKLNFSIQLPGDESSQLDLHSDCWSGDTPFQLNLWIPLTPCFASNSMFLLSEEKSFECIRLINRVPTLDRKLLSQYVSDEDFLEMKVGEAIIFNPGLIHGNMPNRTDQTRVSINVRFKSVFSPDASNQHISRSVGSYYRVFQMSDWTELAIRLHRINNDLLVPSGQSEE